MSRSVAVVLLCALPAVAADRPTVKVEDSPPPKELAEPVRAILSAAAMTVLDAKGQALCTVWPRKALESKATAEQAAAGLRYGHLSETTVLAAVRFPAVFSDYRKQKVKAGVYVLRLGLQPMDGDHMGTAPYNDFGLLAPAALDRSPELLDPKELHAVSGKSSNRNHPGVMLLYPNRRPGDSPTVDPKADDTWVLSYAVPTAAAGRKTDLGFSLVVVGHSASE